MKRVILYIRVSTQEQVDGYSIAAQKDRLISYCQALDLVIVDIVVDAGFSGSNLDRPGIQSVVSMVRAGDTDCVLVYKLDRLSRSQKDTLFLIEDVFLPAGVHFISMQEAFDTSTPFGVAMVGILSVFAQLERSNIQERTFSGRVERAKEGLWHGGGNDPIGYDYVDGALRINTAEAEQVRLVFDLYSSGASVTAIRDRMVDLGYETKYGPWIHTNTVRMVLDNELYTGVVHFDGAKSSASHPAIVSRALFDSVASLRRNSRKNRTAKDTAHLLTGFLFCSSCGARYFPRQNRSGNVYYCCHSRAKVSRSMVTDPSCKNKNWRKSDLEAFVVSELFRIASDPVAALEIANNKKAPTDGGSLPGSADVLRIEEEIKETMNLYKSDHVPVEAVSEQIKELYKKKATIHAALGASFPGAELVNGIPSAIRLLLIDLPSSWASWDLRYQRHVLRQLVSGVYISGDLVDIAWSW